MNTTSTTPPPIRVLVKRKSDRRWSLLGEFATREQAWSAIVAVPRGYRVWLNDVPKPTPTGKEMTASEVYALGRELEALERPKAQERKATGVNQHTEPAGKFPQGSAGRTADKVGEALGMSGSDSAISTEVNPWG